VNIHEGPPRPEPRVEHDITEKEIVEQELFELESADNTLLSGPSSRLHNLATLFRVGKDLLYAFRKLHFAGPCVTIFGSARTKPGTRLLRNGAPNGRGLRSARLHRDDRRRPRHHAGGNQGCL
jgi:hypothetical protein